VTITGGAVEGRIRFDTVETGAWYPVLYGDVSGWVWSERLDFDALPPIETDEAIALENARIWSYPDVTIGAIHHNLPQRAVVEIIGGPVTGRIRLDTSAIGVWYQVRYGTVTGWVWEERLRF
jgi:hypothetical protein